jgi:glycosyltransferase involved in cell wall biosynthesis
LTGRRPALTYLWWPTSGNSRDLSGNAGTPTSKYLMHRFAINGRFLSQNVTGVQRYAYEVVSALDRLIDEDKSIAARYSFEIVAPIEARAPIGLKNIPVRGTGRLSGHAWEQIELPGACDNAFIINLANTGPLRARQQIVTIHDASVFAAPSGYSTTFRLWYRFLSKRLCRRATHIVTDSLFSQNELQRFCGLPHGKSTVIPLGGDHILRAQPDASVLSRNNLDTKPFVLAVGSLNPNKNLAALGETAERLAEVQLNLVIVGGENRRVFASSDTPFPSSVKHLGHVTDAELRALYERAVCFVFPSRYEGFGLTPLEAMTCGCPVVSSRAASLPEVGGSAVLYVNPDNPREIANAVMTVAGNLSVQEKLRTAGREQAAKFSWVSTARQWQSLLDRLS